MTEILLSIILLLGGAGGPGGDFDSGTAVSQPTATSQTTSSPEKQKKGSFD